MHVSQPLAAHFPYPWNGLPPRRHFETYYNNWLQTGTGSSSVYTLVDVYTPTVTAGAVTISLANGGMQKVVTAENTTITLPAAKAGAEFSIIVQYGGAHTITWAGGSTILWESGVPPTATSSSGKYDIYNFKCHDTTYTFGSDDGRNFGPPSYLLLESGDYLLLESGDKFVLE